MAEFQELTKAINDESAYLVQTAQNMTMIECTRQICREVGSLDIEQDSNKDKLIGVGHVLEFLTGTLNNMKIGSRKFINTAFLTNASDNLFVFVALRPMSTAMVIAGRSVHLTTLYPGQA